MCNEIREDQRIEKKDAPAKTYRAKKKKKKSHGCNGSNMIKPGRTVATSNVFFLTGWGTILGRGLEGSRSEKSWVCVYVKNAMIFLHIEFPAGGEGSAAKPQ